MVSLSYRGRKDRESLCLMVNNLKITHFSPPRQLFIFYFLWISKVMTESWTYLTPHCQAISASLYCLMYLTKDVLFIKIKDFSPLVLTQLFDVVICAFLCTEALKATWYLIDFPGLSFCLSKLLSVGQVPVRVGEWREKVRVKKKCLTGSKHFWLCRGSSR